MNINILHHLIKVETCHDIIQRITKLWDTAKLMNLKKAGLHQFWFLTSRFLHFFLLNSFTINVCKLFERCRTDLFYTDISYAEQAVARENTNILVWVKASWNLFTLSSTSYCPHSEIIFQIILYLLMHFFSIFHSILNFLSYWNSAHNQIQVF